MRPPPIPIREHVMRNALRLFSVAFIIVEMCIIYVTFALDKYWPDQAVDYWEWQASQSLEGILAALPYTSLALTCALLLCAIALLLGFYAVRWLFALAIVVVLLVEVIIAFNVPPQLVGADYVLNEIAILLAGIVASLSFCVVNMNRDGAP